MMKIIIFESVNMCRDEKIIHETLAKYRQPTSELFKCDRGSAINVCEKVTGKRAIYIQN